MQNITIKKVTMKSHLFLSAEFDEKISDGVGGNTTRSHKLDCTIPIHDDLKAAFKKLNIHLALLCEQVPPEYKKGMNVVTALGEVAEGMDPDGLYKFQQPVWDILHKIRCTSFMIGGSSDNENVTLYGSRDISGDKTLSLSSPSQKFDGDNRIYDHISELAEIIEECRNEAYLYLFEGKRQPEAQQDLFAGLPEGVTVTVTANAGPAEM